MEKRRESMQAKHELAQAVEDAKKVIADAAAEALKISHTAGVKTSEDHDLLIRIATQVEQVITDVRDLKTNTVGRIERIEVDYTGREEHAKVVDDIVVLKSWKNWLVGAWGVAGAVLVFLAIALFNHLVGK